MSVRYRTYSVIVGLSDGGLIPTVWNGGMTVSDETIGSDYYRDLSEFRTNS